MIVPPYITLFISRDLLFFDKVEKSKYLAKGLDPFISNTKTFTLFYWNKVQFMLGAYWLKENMTSLLFSQEWRHYLPRKSK